jgi:aryl-alcohol dehydrogenase-like predicted oxidoreductase
MDLQPLGSTDLNVSSLGIGTGTFSREIDAEASYEIMDYAVERGFNLIDTAEAYSDGGAEKVVGDWIKNRRMRDQIVLATKVDGSLTRSRIATSAEASLRRLQVDTVDLFYAHSWSENVPLEETLEALSLLVQQGKARYIACSNFSASQVEQSLAVSIDRGWPQLSTVQPHYNLSARDIEHDLLPLCADRKLGVVSYSPLGAGFLTGKYRKDGPTPAGTRFDVIPGHQDVYFSDQNFRKVEALRSISDETGLSMVQLALAWITNQPGITSVLIGARSTGHVDQALHADKSVVSPDLKARLNNL